MTKFAIINGPNLNLTGRREISMYGTRSFEEYFKELTELFPEVSFQFFQSNIEGELINEIHRAGENCNGIILNPGGYTHTSVAIGDAIASVSARVVEVHLSNIFAREEFRKISHVSAKVSGIISGMGMLGYELAVRYLLQAPSLK